MRLFARPLPWLDRLLLVGCALAIAIFGAVVATGKERREPRWDHEGLWVEPRPIQVSGPDGRPWWIVRARWGDLRIEAVTTGPTGEREAWVLIAVLTAAMSR